MLTTRPLIGLTLDHETTETYSRFPWYALRQNYVDWMAGAGAVPVALPHETALVEELVQRLDGLVVTGGAFDVDPALFGAGGTPCERDDERPTYGVRGRHHAAGPRTGPSGSRRVRRRAAAQRGAGRLAAAAYSRCRARRAGT